MSIAAKFPGWCPECGTRWQEGDQIEFMSDGISSGWVHAECPNWSRDGDPLPPARAGEVACPACWLIHPEGACDR